MNERIKQISDQVWEWAENQEYSEPDQFSDIWETKFAELIVRECMSLMQTEKKYYEDPSTYETKEYYIRMQAKSEAFEEADDIIRSHFGVEE